MGKSIFISGALGFGSKEFLNNCHLMLKYAGEVRKVTPYLYVPINDLNITLTSGSLTHENYYDIDLYWLDKCDAIALVPNPNNEKSVGVANEIIEATKLNKPILRTLNEIVNFVEE